MIQIMIKELSECDQHDGQLVVLRHVTGNGPIADDTGRWQ